VAAFNLCDTTGMAYPRQVRSMLSLLRREFPTQAISLHFHNTRGLGIANALAAAAEGFTRFDASVGGLGGCPFAPGATGNVCTEDLVHALHLEGYETGIDLNALLALAANLPAIIHEGTHGHIAEAGPRTRRYALPASATQAT
jgi:hydroxymethylglutaryl-CoA lyase